MTSEWCSKSKFNDADSRPTNKQSLWDKPLLQQIVKTLFLDTVDSYNRPTACLKAVSSPHALPITACGLRLDNEDVRAAVGLRLGAAICKTVLMGTWSPNRRTVSHGLSCFHGFGLIARHSTINNNFIIHRSLSRTGNPSIKEPPCN